ncbi:hypothetical protein AOLI_G00273890 [Acnodon oligacanthus]
MNFSAVCVVLMTIVTAASHSVVTSVKVKRHSSATLPCSESCSGSVKWETIHRPGDFLGHCSPVSCWLKEGYQMSHEKYLTGDLSLTIADADFSKRGLYTCQCDGKELCSVRLLIEVSNTALQLNSGESLVLDLEIPEEVEVIYNSTAAAGPSSGQICTVDGRSLQCKPEYRRRMSSALKLSAVTPSDSGLYTVKDKRNEEVIHTYAVMVESAGGSDKMKDVQPERCTGEGAVVSMWVFGLIMAALLTVIVGLAVAIGLLRRQVQQCRKRTEGNGVEKNGHSVGFFPVDTCTCSCYRGIRISGDDCAAKERNSAVLD